MIDGLPTLGPADRPPPVRKATANTSTAQAAGAPDLSFPGAPPAEVLDALGAAQHVMEELASRELRFSVNESDGKIHVTVVSSEGTVVREIPVRDALEILSGARPPGLGVDAVG